MPAVKRMKVNDSRASVVLQTPFPQDADENFDSDSQADDKEEERK